MTLLPTATHIDIAAAMALWILADHSQLGVVARMTTRVETSLITAFFLQQDLKNIKKRTGIKNTDSLKSSANYLFFS